MYKLKTIDNPKNKNNKIMYFILSAVAVVIAILIPILGYGYNPGGPPIFEPQKLGIWGMALLNGNMCEWINGLFYNSLNTIQNISLTDRGLTADWEHLFGNSTAFHDALTNVSNTIIKPIAGAILSCVFLMQFIKLTGRAENHGTLPLFKEMVVLFLYMTFFTLLIAHCDDICNLIYTEVTKIAKAIQTGQIQVQSITKDFIGPDCGDGHKGDWKHWENFECNFGDLMFIWLSMLALNVVAFFAGIIVTVMVFARALQLYILAAFSPIPFSMLGFDETRSWGVGFFKNFASVALAGVIILVLLFGFPYIVAGIFNDQNLNETMVWTGQLSGNDSFEHLKSGILLAGNSIAVGIVLIVAVLKSGAWAKEILGS